MMAGEMREERVDGGRRSQPERRVRFHVCAASARSRRRRRRLSHRMRRSDSRRTGRSHRRLLYLGLAQAGHSHRRTHRAAALASGAIRRVSKAATTSSMSAPRPITRSCRWCGICSITSASDVFCVGSNYVWTWETNRVIREIVTSAGGRILAERLLELGETAVDHIVKEIIDRKPPVVFNTLVGESSYVFMRALHEATTRAGLTIPDAELQPVRAGAQADRIGGLRRMHHLVGLFREHRRTPENRAFVARWKARHGADSSPLRRRAVDLCLRHAAGARHPPRRLRRRQRRPARRGQSPLRFPARPDLGRSRQQSLLPDAAPGALRARLPVQDILGSGRPGTARPLSVEPRPDGDRRARAKEPGDDRDERR